MPRSVETSKRSAERSAFLEAKGAFMTAGFAFLFFVFEFGVLLKSLLKEYIYIYFDFFFGGFVKQIQVNILGSIQRESFLNMIPQQAPVRLRIHLSITWVWVFLGVFVRVTWLASWAYVMAKWVKTGEPFGDN